MSLPHDMLTQEYIEIIARLEKEQRVARVKDIADRRGVTRSSVSLALNQLSKKQLITHEAYGHAMLTAAGRRLAQKLTQRHQAVKNLLVNLLGLDEAIAEQDACKFEHLISAETFLALTRFLDFMRQCPNQAAQNLRDLHKCTYLHSPDGNCSQCPLK
jgi:DtxR family transcriptional regulator, Mn-dependent transcriptional regulator